MNQNQEQGRQRVGFEGRPIGRVVSRIAAGIGLASEAMHHQKEKKAAKKAATALAEESGSATPPSYEEHQFRDVKGDAKHHDEHHDEEQILEEGDEEQWDLDDAQDELIPQPPERKFERDPKKITQHFIDKYPAPEVPVGQLRLPVVLPQRRPKNRTRGFIRAYAPELENCGIDQAMFLDFIETFDLASQAALWINAINLAGIAFNFLPSGISQAAGLALNLTVEVAKNMQSRARYNSFLDQINDDFYRPRGLYCLVLTWNPESDESQISLNITEKIASNLDSPSGIVQKTTHSLAPSMGNTNGVLFTETAPLIFPALDNLADEDTQEAKGVKEKLKGAAKFTGDYFDRRAQAKYAGKNPESELVVGPKPTFTSKYADPNHPASSGDPVALLTGGKVSLGSGGREGSFGRLGGLGGRRRMRDGVLGMGGGGGRMGMDMGGGGGGRMGMGTGESPGRMGSGMGRGPGRMGMMGMAGGGGYYSDMGMGGAGGMGMGMDMGGGVRPITTPTPQTGGGRGVGDFDNRMGGYQQRDAYSQGQHPQGPYTQEQYMQEQHMQEQDMQEQYQAQQQYGGRRTRKIGRRGVGFGGLQMARDGIKRILKHHVLYLLIVNLPTEEEIAYATQVMGQGAQASAQ